MRVLAPVRDQAPPQTGKGSLAVLRIPPDHPLLLAGSAVEPRENVQRLNQRDDAEPELMRMGFLSGTTTHAR